MYDTRKHHKKSLMFKNKKRNALFFTLEKSETLKASPLEDIANFINMALRKPRPLSNKMADIPVVWETYDLKVLIRENDLYEGYLVTKEPFPGYTPKEIRENYRDALLTVNLRMLDDADCVSFVDLEKEKINDEIYFLKIE